MTSLFVDLRVLRGKICDTSEKLENFNVYFPTTACPHTFHISKVFLYDLKKVAINEFGILNIKPCMCQISGTWELLLREY
jgi:hypothetical protein